jgi:predicted O-methyltransferase YrrM
VSEELELVASENQRLLKEIRQLRARVEALESSRWWRLHPRVALRRLWPFRGATRAEPATTEPNPPQVTDLTESFRAEVMARGSFSHDWFTGSIASWEPVLQLLEGGPSNILELGSFEGLSASFLLWRLPEARVTCVDTFAGSPEHLTMDVDRARLEDNFDRNVALVDAARVHKVAGKSADVLLQLRDSGERFDFVYVDASHLALDVIVDAALAWPLLVPGGILVFDDYGWRSPLGEDPLLVPGPAVDAFLGLVGRHCEVVAKGAQAIVRKTASATETLADPAHESARSQG